jgi:hypothetical protein
MDQAERQRRVSIRRLNAYLRQQQQAQERVARADDRATERVFRQLDRELAQEQRQRDRAARRQQRQQARERKAAEESNRDRQRKRHNEDKPRSGRRGRKPGTRMRYSNAQTVRYRSFFLRKQRAARLPPPTRKGTAYLFRAYRKRHPPYRTTAIADQSGLSTEVQTAGEPVIFKNPETVDVKWDFGKLQLRFAAAGVRPPPPTPSIGAYTTPPYPLPRDESLDGRLRRLCTVFFGATTIRYYSNIPDTDPDPGVGLGGAFTGVQREEFASGQTLIFPAEQWAGLGDGYPVYQSDRTEPQNGFWTQVTDFAQVRISPPFLRADPGFYPTPPQLPDGFPSTPGATPPTDDWTAGILWESNEFQLDNNLDILLSIAYFVRQPGASGSYIRVFKDGSQFAELDVADYRKGAQFQDRPVTLVAPGTFRFQVRIAPQSQINAAVVRLGGDSYVCNCPDWNKKSKSFPSRFPSELQDRDWSTSGAGARGDCKHIMRVKMILGVPIIRNAPDDLDTIRQWRRDGEADQKSQRRQERRQLARRRRDARQQQLSDRRQQRAAERQRQRQVREKYDLRYAKARAQRQRRRRSTRYGDRSY